MSAVDPGVDYEQFKARMSAWDERAAKLRRDPCAFGRSAVEQIELIAAAAPKPPKPAPPRPVRQVSHAAMVARIAERSASHGDCVLWMGAASENGYGRIRTPGGFLKLPHRIVLEHTLGRRLYSDEDTRHTCDVPRCVKPEHLLPGSRSENTCDMRDRDRMQRGSFARCPLCLRPLGTQGSLVRCEGWRPHMLAELRKLVGSESCAADMLAFIESQLGARAA